MQKTPDMLWPDGQSDKCSRCSDTHMQKAFNVWLESSNVKYAINLATSCQYVTRKVQITTHPSSTQSRKPKAQQLHVGALYTLHDAESSA